MCRANLDKRGFCVYVQTNVIKKCVVTRMTEGSFPFQVGEISPPASVSLLRLLKYYYTVFHSFIGLIKLCFLHHVCVLFDLKCVLDFIVSSRSLYCCFKLLLCRAVSTLLVFSFFVLLVS